MSKRQIQSQDIDNASKFTVSSQSVIVGLMSKKTIVVHVRYKSLYISLPSFTKQQREMTKFCVVY